MDKLITFYEDGKTYDVDSSKISRTKVNHINKVENQYMFYVLDKKNNRNHVFFKAKTLKEAAAMQIPYEDKDYIAIRLSNNYIERYGHSHNVFLRPAERDMAVGDKCSFGNIDNFTILAKDNVSYYVKIENDNGTKYDILHWSQANPAVVREPFENPRNDIWYSNTTISSLLHKMFYFGCDMNPEYQRGNVWTVEQEEKLIDSIFKQINIGAFVFVEKDWACNGDVVDDMYEILDGKQRLTAILHFVEGKIKYNGLCYHEMSRYNQFFFEDTQILMGELKFRDGYDKKKVLENFIRLNECGSTVDSSVIEKAKEIKSHLEGTEMK